MTRRALAKAYVSLMDKYPSNELSAAVVAVARASKLKLDIGLLAQDIAAELLLQKDILTADVKFAHQPSNELLAQVESALVKQFGTKNVALDAVVDDDVIGGFVAETPAGTIDTSVRAMLDNLEVA